MEHEIEEAQRQIRRSAAIIQDAFEGLTTLQRLHNRVSEVSPSARAPTDIPSAISTSRPTQDRVGPPAMLPNSMDPGHDVIVISAENSTLPPPSSTSTSVPASPTQHRTSSSLTAASSSPRGPRPSDPALAALGLELRTMTQSFRERVGEFDELRRAIAQYAQERHSRGVTAERTRSRSPPPSADPYNPAPHPPLYPAASTSSPVVASAGTTQAASGTSAPRRFDGRIRPIRGELRMFDRSSSLLRPRDGNEAETSLGMLVAARAAASSNDTNSVADTPIIPPASVSASARFTSDRPRPVAVPVSDLSESTGSRPSSRVLPSNITARITRLAQEIQQEGARITQQAESLRSWINDRNARLDALRPSVSVSASRNVFTQATPPISTRGTDPNPTMILGEEYDPLPIPNVTPPRFTTGLFAEPPMVPLSQIPRTNEPDVRGRELPNDVSPARSRRTPDGAVRARYLRQNVPTSWSATGPSASNPREDQSIGVPWNNRRERMTDGPLSPPSRTIAPTGSRGGLRDAGTSMSASTGTVLDDFEVESYNPTSSVRAALAIARVRSQRRVTEVADDDEDFTDSRSYRVRRRYNADGDEEVIRVSLRPDISSSPGSGLSFDRRRPPLDLEDDSGEEDSWMEAISRLDTMSRRTAARGGPPDDSWQPPRMVRSGTQMGTMAPAPAVFSAYPASLAGRRSTRGWPRLPYAEEDVLFAESETQYERDLSAMRSRARALLSATAPTRALGGTTLPPPPPPTRPLSFVPTTQAPGSLWNDSSVRVRLRTRVNEVLERQADSPTPPLERSRRERNGRDVAPRARSHRAEGSEAERPMWGSPTPFYPSALPLPLVENVGSLQARSRVFGSAEKIACMPRKRAVSQVGR